MMRCVKYHLRRVWRDEAGAAAFEFAIAASLTFFMFFVLLDFGRLAYSQVMAEKAVHMAARTAVVRPAVCGAVPEWHDRGGLSPAPRFGTACSAAAGTCANVGTISCAGVATNATALEIWNTIQPWMPPGTAIENINFIYEYDQNLGFLGGPYTPMVTVDFDLPDFQFISPIGALAVAAGAASAPVGTSFTYPDFSVSLPAEDLALGEDG